MAKVFRSSAVDPESGASKSEPCVMVIFGASGDVTKRLVVPALYNLRCDGLLSDNFAVLGAGRTEMDDAEFRARIGGEKDGLRAFHTRKEFDEAAAADLLNRMYFQTADIKVEDFRKLKNRVRELDARHGAGGNVLFYFAMAPRFFGPLCDTLYEAGFQEGAGWKRAGDVRGQRRRVNVSTTERARWVDVGGASVVVLTFTRTPADGASRRGRAAPEGGT